MMILLAAIIGIGAALLLLSAGYVFGVSRGYQAREQLRQQNLELAEALALTRQDGQQSGQDADETLRLSIQQLLNPLIQREQLSFDLSNLQAVPGRRSDLTALLDQIAEKGNLSAVLLSDEEGWPLASSGNARNPEKLGATASLLLLLADRFARDDSPAPLSLMVHDESNTVTLSRIFRVGGQRLSLTAVSTGNQLTPTALDPALVKVDAVLASGA
jgi:hypothetical protein